MNRTSSHSIYRQELEPYFNEDSKYEERTVIRSLTLYDIEREPRPQDPNPSRSVALTVAMNRELTCPICLGVLRDTAMVMECAHRFCSECIQKSLRYGNGFCPACRLKIASRRSLRKDTAFDALISTIYPDLDGFEEKQFRRMQRNNKHMQESHRIQVEKIRKQSKKHRSSDHPKAESLEVARDARSAAQAPANRRRTASTSPEGASSNGGGGQRKRPKTSAAAVAAAAAAAAAGGAAPPQSLFNFLLRKHPGESGLRSLQHEALRTPAACTVGHVKKWLGKKLSVAPDFEILVHSQLGHIVTLEPSQTLQTVRERFWPEASELLLYYRRGRGDAAPVPVPVPRLVVPPRPPPPPRQEAAPLQMPPAPTQQQEQQEGASRFAATAAMDVQAAPMAVG